MFKEITPYSYYWLLANQVVSFWSGACILIPNENTDQDTSD